MVATILAFLPPQPRPPELPLLTLRPCRRSSRPRRRRSYGRLFALLRDAPVTSIVLASSSTLLVMRSRLARLSRRALRLSLLLLPPLSLRRRLSFTVLRPCAFRRSRRSSPFSAPSQFQSPPLFQQQFAPPSLQIDGGGMGGKGGKEGKGGKGGRGGAAAGCRRWPRTRPRWPWRGRTASGGLLRRSLQGPESFRWPLSWLSRK